MIGILKLEYCPDRVQAYITKTGVSECRYRLLSFLLGHPTPLFDIPSDHLLRIFSVSTQAFIHLYFFILLASYIFLKAFIMKLNIKQTGRFYLFSGTQVLLARLSGIFCLEFSKYF